MRALFWTLLILSVSMASLAMRSKRSPLELSEVVECSTGRSAISYASYGCYCGLGGQGWPIDDTDWCCFRHDCCYDTAERAGCHPMIDTYRWKCVDNEANCDSIRDRCEKIICQCDRELGKCFRKSFYDEKYRLWPNFKCGKTQPTCN